MSAMHILLTNDDGYRSPGLHVLARGLSDLGRLSVVAPHVQRSGVARAITIHRSLNVKNMGTVHGTPVHAVDGTPADCVKLALGGRVLDERPDLVVSGINLGHNAGVNALYSGTVAAAAEGALLGVPAIAVSLATHKPPCWWETAVAVTRAILLGREAASVAPGTVLNINVPNRALADVAGYRSTRMTPSLYDNEFESAPGPDGKPSYSYGGELRPTADGQRKESDLHALEEGYVTLTPLMFDLTHEQDLARLRSAIPALLPLLDGERQRMANTPPQPYPVLEPAEGPLWDRIRAHFRR